MSKKNKKEKYHQPRKKYWSVFVILIVILIIGGFFLLRKPPEEKNISQSQCQVKEMIFYYLDECEWCQKVKNEGTIEKIGQLGVSVKEINTAIGPVRHRFASVPTFVINDKVYSGYKTFDELKKLLGCPNQENNDSNQTQPPPLSGVEFIGEKGQTVILADGEVKLDASIFNDNQTRFYNLKMSDGKVIYFFVVKDKNGVYRAAANACQVCFSTGKGFHQDGDEIVCNNCGNRYPIEKIATEKGGCNPGPISPNLEVKNNKVIIKQADLEQVADLF